MFRDRAYCIRTRADLPKGLIRCGNEACDRNADRNVLRLAAKAGQPIGWADLETTKCGFVPREGEK